VGENVSHLLLELPSMARSLVSDGGFSPLAVTATTSSITLPGSREDTLPVTLWLRSAVLVHAGCGSPSSNDEKKRFVAPWAAGAPPASSIASANSATRRIPYLMSPPDC
jgi:hypothetical protein